MINAISSVQPNLQSNRSKSQKSDVSFEASSTAQPCKTFCNYAAREFPKSMRMTTWASLGTLIMTGLFGAGSYFVWDKSSILGGISAGFAAAFAVLTGLGIISVFSDRKLLKTCAKLYS